MFERFLAILPLAADNSSSASSLTTLRENIADTLMFVFGLASAVTLVMVVIYIMQGDRDSAKKFAGWLSAMVVGFVLFAVVKAI